MSMTIIYFHVYVLLDFPIAYRNASVLCQSESTENTYPKERALMQMYRVVPIMKRRNCCYRADIGLKLFGP